MQTSPLHLYGRSFRRILAMALGLAFLLGFPACASKLKRDLTNKGRVDKPLDFDEIFFTDVASGESLSLASYIEQTGRRFLLLSFGAPGCGKCVEKNGVFVDRIIDRHDLYLSPAGQGFEIIGINTQQGGNAERYYRSFPFVRWHDPAGLVMKERFYPSDQELVQIPFMTLVDVQRGGIVLTILAEDKKDPDEIMAMVQEKILGLRPTPTGSPTVSPTPTRSPTPSTRPDPDDLEALSPGRLSKIKTTSCAAAISDLEAAVADVDVKFVHVVRGACGANCQANIAQLDTLATKCAAGAIAGKTCKVTTLVEEGQLAGSVCNAVSGVFSSPDTERFFVTSPGGFGSSWIQGLDVKMENDDPTSFFVEDVDPTPVTGSVLFAFSKEGPLLDVRTGALAATAIESSMASAEFSKVHRGWDYPLYRSDVGEVDFATWRRQKKYSIVQYGGFKNGCDSCREELEHWNRPGDLYDLCERSGQCQIMVVDPTMYSGSERDDWFQGTQNNVTELANRDLNVHVDARGVDDWPNTQQMVANRYMEGYTTAVVGFAAVSAGVAAESSYRTVVLNQEGNLLMVDVQTLDLHPEHVTDFVRELLQEGEQHDQAESGHSRDSD